MFETEIFDNGTQIITGYTGMDTVARIPPEIEGTVVTEIGEYAFYGYTWLEEIVLLDGIAEIGYEAFCGCMLLKRVNLPR